MSTLLKTAMVMVATRQELQNKHYYNRLWITSRNLKIGRRKWLDEISLAFFRYQGTILNSNGTAFVIPDIDTVFGDDPDMRWLSYYFKADETDKTPRTVSRKFQRVQLIDLYIRIKYPKFAHHIAR